AGGRPGRAASVPGRRVRRTDLYLPAQVRGRSAGHAPGAGPRGQAGRAGREPGVPGPAVAFLAVLVVALHPPGAAPRPAAPPPPRVVRRGPVPPPEHLRPLPSLP